MQVIMHTVEPGAGEVDCFRGASGQPYICCTDHTLEGFRFKLPADDDGMADAIELMDPFQTYPFNHTLGFMRPKAA